MNPGLRDSGPLPVRAKKGRRRCGFSTGTAAVAAANAALRYMITGVAPKVIAVHLPFGIYLPIPISIVHMENEVASAAVIKDGGDDPDITDGAEIIAKVRILDSGKIEHQSGACRLFLIGGKGVGQVTKAGLPVPPPEPAINPVPREMFVDNICSELLTGFSSGYSFSRIPVCTDSIDKDFGRREAGVWIDLAPAVGAEKILPGRFIEVKIMVPRGEELAKHTLNPRLGIVGGISILGTTGIVKPFSHEAYEETIRAALSVAAGNGCTTAILSTGGKSERFARELVQAPAEAFVQIADFFAFAVQESIKFRFRQIVHSVFFGKAVKMAQGHAYTHAHSVPLEIDFLVGVARDAGVDDALCRQLADANTARHALEILEAGGRSDIAGVIGEMAKTRSKELAGRKAEVRLLLFDYNGSLLADVR